MLAMKAVVREDKNVVCVGFAMDALNRLAHSPPPSRPPQDEKAPPRNPRPLLHEMQAHLRKILGQSQVPWETLVWGGLQGETFY